MASRKNLERKRKKEEKTKRIGNGKGENKCPHKQWYFSVCNTIALLDTVFFLFLAGKNRKDTSS